jgi:hypothetical protein
VIAGSIGLTMRDDPMPTMIAGRAAFVRVTH